MRFGKIMLISPGEVETQEASDNCWIGILS